MDEVECDNVSPVPELVSVEERLSLFNSSKWKVGIGFVAGLASNLADVGLPGLAGAALGWLVWIAAWAIFIWGCADLVRAKGYVWQYCFLGLIWWIGYAILYFMKDKWLAETHLKRLQG